MIASFLVEYDDTTTTRGHATNKFPDRPILQLLVHPGGYLVRPSERERTEIHSTTKRESHSLRPLSQLRIVA